MMRMSKKKQQEPSTEEQETPAERRRKAGLKNIAPYKFKPGESGNPSGRTPDILKGIALRLAQLKIGKILSAKQRKVLKNLGLEETNITMIEGIMLDWATSSNPVKQQLFAERLAGKVPNVNINAEVNAQLVTKFRNKLTDGELSRIAAGEDALDILLEKLPDVVEERNAIDVSEEMEIE